MLKLMTTLQVAVTSMLANVGDEPIIPVEEQDAILGRIRSIGTIVTSVAFAIGVIFVAVGLIKAGIILADADKAGPEQTAKAKTAVKNNVIALIIMAVPFVVLLTGFQSWILSIVKNMWWG